MFGSGWGRVGVEAGGHGHTAIYRAWAEVRSGWQWAPTTSPYCLTRKPRTLRQSVPGSGFSMILIWQRVVSRSSAILAPACLGLGLS